MTLRVVVCGSNFGRHYLRAAIDDPEFEAVGLVGRGSERSRALAAALGVRLFGSVAELPDDVNIACVAVQQKDAEALIKSLLERKISVITEHPVSVGLVDRSHRIAAASGARFHVNFHIADYEIIERFTAEAARMIAKEPPLFVSAFTSPRCVYQVVDIIGRALGGVRPTSGFRDAAVASAAVALRSCTGLFAGVPATISLTSFKSAVDDLSDAFLNHQVTIGFRSGNLILADTIGPVIWCSRGLNEVLWTEPSVQREPPAGELSHVTLDEMLKPARGYAMRAALRRLRAHIETGDCPKVQSPQYVREVCELSKNLELALFSATS